MRVFVTGGTGLVGTRLVARLLARGDQPVVLSRRPAPARQAFGPQAEVVEGDPAQAGPWMDRIDDCDAVIHLAGENLFAARWSAAFKQRLLDSRVLGTQNVAQALQRKPTGPGGQAKVLVKASAIGYYGPHGDEELTEESPPGSDYLAGMCVQWEKAAAPVEAAGVRLAQVRIGVVLDKGGGALAQLITPFKLGGGGPVASGKQWMSWVHHDDLLGLLLLALDNADCRGPLNGTAPHPVTNKDFSTALGKALHRPSFVWTPGVALRLALGEVANVVIQGQRVLPSKALSLGYTFRFPTIDAAFAEIFAPGKPS
jgi:uncharacterized protein (TIGR01777 family)